MVGEQDDLEGHGILYSNLIGINNKVLVAMVGATHFATWETSQYKFVHKVSLEWLTAGQFRGRYEGTFSIGVNGAEPSVQ